MAHERARSGSPGRAFLRIVIGSLDSADESWVWESTELLYTARYLAKVTEAVYLLTHSECHLPSLAAPQHTLKRVSYGKKRRSEFSGGI
jgi:hypothetical protein